MRQPIQRTRSFGLMAAGDAAAPCGVRRGRCRVGPEQSEAGARPVLDATRCADRPALASASCRALLEKALGDGLDYYSEYIDQARFPDRDLPGRRSATSCARSTRAQRFDVVIAIQDVAIEFVDDAQELAVSRFADRFLYASTAQVRRARTRPASSNPLNFGRHARAGRSRCSPRSGTCSSSAAPTAATSVYETPGASAVPIRSNPSCDITYLSGCATKDLEARLATLPEHSAVYYLLVNRDGAGDNFHPLEYLDRVAARANAPTYCWVDSAMDHGIVGGSSQRAGERRSRPSAALALRVLRGEPADSIPVSVARSECQVRSTGASCGAGASAKRACRGNARQVPGTVGLGSLQGLHPRRGRRSCWRRRR